MTNHFHLIIINTNEYAMLLLHSANGSYRCLASNLKSGKSENQRQKRDQTALVFLVCFWRIFFERRMSIYDSERSCRTSKRTTSSIPGWKASGSAVCRNRLQMAPHTAPMSANALTTPWLCQRDSVSAPLILITRWDGVNSVKAMR